MEDAEGADWLAVLPVPDPRGHKHDRGHAAVVAGPRHATGAARLAAGAALRVGAGLVTVLASRSAADIVASHATAVMVALADGADGLEEALARIEPSAIAIGPGLAPDARTRELVASTLRHPAAVVLDAGALSAHEGMSDALFGAIAARGDPCVLTPHAGEFARLLGPGEGEGAVREAARRSGAVVLAKGPRTRVAAPDGRFASSSHGPPWLATAGTGDVLAGLVTGLLAQGMPAFEAARAAVWMHGEAARRLGPGMTADDLDAALRPVVGAAVRARQRDESLSRTHDR